MDKEGTGDALNPHRLALLPHLTTRLPPSCPPPNDSHNAFTHGMFGDRSAVSGGGRHGMGSDLTGWAEPD
jgi:hypothetical protein